MPYAGKTLMLRDILHHAVSAEAYDGSKPFSERKVELGYMIGSESGGNIGAWHDNYSSAMTAMYATDEDPYGLLVKRPELLEGRTVVEALAEMYEPVRASTHLGIHAATFLSRDCGPGQVNIPASKVGTALEQSLRTESLDPDVYLPVLGHNLDACADLYVEPWVFSDGKHEKRQWQAWVGVRSGWGPYGKSWAWSRVTANTWVATGRFCHRSIRAVGNWHRVYNGKSTTWALNEVNRLKAIYEVDSDYFIDSNGMIGIRFPAKPTHAGSDADYPKPNDGRSYLTQWAKAQA